MEFFLYFFLEIISMDFFFNFFGFFNVLFKFKLKFDFFFQIFFVFFAFQLILLKRSSLLPMRSLYMRVLNWAH